jgi:hypothetical protein
MGGVSLARYRFRKFSDGVNELLVCELCGAMFFTVEDARRHAIAHEKGYLSRLAKAPRLRW